MAAPAQKPSAGAPAADIDRAGVLMSQGKAAEALAVLERIAASHPDVPGIEAKLGQAYFKNGKFTQAASHLQPVVQKAPEDWESAQLLALSYYSLGDCQRALPLLARLRGRISKGSVDGPYLEGVCSLKTGDWDNARKAFASMFSAPPDSASAYLMLAKMMVRNKMEDRSVAQVQKALELEPKLPMAHFLLGELYLYQGRPPAALQEFQQELAINPTVWLVYWRLGDAYSRLERYEEAENALKQSIWLNESFTGSYLLLGEIQLKKGDAELAAGFLEHALKLDPQNSYAHFALAKAYQRLGRSEEANRHFEITRALRKEKKEQEELSFQQVTRTP
ncbi:MAG: tetratricopeptide repeat protein [Bryobacteraceae bacterium]